jgi:2-dehydropantoate 2-reductase
MRFAIVGVGNYGARFAARLMQAGQDVTLIARGRTLVRLRTQGLTAPQSPTTPAIHIATVRATDDPTSVGPVDVVCLCVKLYQLDDAMDVARPLVGPATTILGLQNGVTAADRLITHFGAAPVVGVGMGLASVPLAIGEFPHGRSARTSAIVQVFKAAGINVVESADVLEAIWGKFIVVCGNTVCALARQPAGGVVQVPALRQLAAMAVAEAITLANAKGLAFGPASVIQADQLWDEIAANNPAARPSLLQDLEAGRPLELDAWSGGAVKIGQELGIPTPVNFAMYAGLKPYENGKT